MGEGRRTHAPRPDEPRLPELLHLLDDPVGIHGELPARARRAGDGQGIAALLETQAAHIIAAATERRKTRIEPTIEAEEAWTQQILDAVLDRRKFLEECTPGYYNGEGGKPNPLAASYSSYGKGSVAFFKLLKMWRESGEFAGLVMS